MADYEGRWKTVLVEVKEGITWFLAMGHISNSAKPAYAVSVGSGISLSPRRRRPGRHHGGYPLQVLRHSEWRRRRAASFAPHFFYPNTIRRNGQHSLQSK